MDIKVSTEKYEVINSGSVIVSLNDVLDFRISNLIFRFSFKSVEGLEPSVKIGKAKDSDNKDYMAIEIINAGKEGFKSNCPPVEVASFDGKKLYLAFALDTLVGHDGNSKLLYYTWFLEK
ncbi:MAG: hypothetical protein NC453_20480 [Muribaculum sp.]|nr:hypothetical protein [Muribaculum sp.]